MKKKYTPLNTSIHLRKCGDKIKKKSHKDHKKVLILQLHIFFH